MDILMVGSTADGSGSPVVRLERLGHEVTCVSTGAAAMEAHQHAELILLDLDLPDIDGLEVCRRIRALARTPVIAFTDSGTELDRVLGLRAGADDCLDKPYEFRELAARIDAVTRRTRPREPARESLTVLSIGALHIDAASREVRVRGRHVDLTRKEFDLLYYLARHSEKVVSRQRLMTEIWEDPRPQEFGPRASRTVDTHVSSLRSKLGDSNWIRTVRGVGFRVGPGCS
ncbi:response regulator transcription factor [Streptomyces sp. SID5910]|uniref:response regulator transcription factor n=1 Tax=Streptomyces sp. SID5910 TaxID=2690312 RepID=UPI001368B6C0|nr:response regulator transcription factor [Streptomyces sp. SID5910]MYR46959.1 response regulator [Streptomyces sp. SID5910]